MEQGDWVILLALLEGISMPLGIRPLLLLKALVLAVGLMAAAVLVFGASYLLGKLHPMLPALAIGGAWVIFLSYQWLAANARWKEQDARFNARMEESERRYKLSLLKPFEVKIVGDKKIMVRPGNDID